MNFSEQQKEYFADMLGRDGRRGMNCLIGAMPNQTCAHVTQKFGGVLVVMITRTGHEQFTIKEASPADAEAIIADLRNAQADKKSNVFGLLDGQLIADKHAILGFTKTKCNPERDKAPYWWPHFALGPTHAVEVTFA